MAPNSPADEAELLKKAADGDTSAEEELVLRYTPLVYSQTRNCYRDGWERSDFVQEGMVGLIRAIREYASARGVPFQAFAAVCIRNELYAALRRTLSAKNLPLEGYVSLSGRDSSALSELLSSDASDSEIERVLDRDEAERLVTELITLLSPFEKKVLSAWLRGYSPEETSNALNRSKKSVDNAMSRIRIKGRKALLRSGENRNTCSHI
ncbi:MAG: sigma-70 family RNA polymerase sigma factor [Eubacteriales bacterium]